MTVKENLIAAKALIDTPEKWIKDAGEKNGSYCVIGALNKISLPSVPEWEVLVKALPDGWQDTISIAAFNDDPDTTHADIMALFDRGIESCED